MMAALRLLIEFGSAEEKRHALTEVKVLASISSTPTSDIAPNIGTSLNEAASLNGTEGKNAESCSESSDEDSEL
jgi:hypothetical protein